LASTEVFVVERCDKCGVLASGVELRVDRAEVERLHLELLDVVAYDVVAVGSLVVPEDTVLGNHLGDELTLGNDLEFDCARVDVGGVETAGAKEPNCHSGAGAHERGECLAVGCDDITPLSSLALKGRVAEVEHELLVIWKKRESVDGIVGDEKLLSKGESIGSCGGLCGRSDAGCIRCVSGVGWSCDAGGGQDGGGDDGVEEHFEKIVWSEKKARGKLKTECRKRLKEKLKQRRRCF